jgi:hypothetical protein
MPAKSKSPEAAQHRVWKAELSTLERSRRKVDRDFDKEADRLHKAVIAAKRKEDAYCTKLKTARPRAMAKIDSRIAVLRGRLGL